MARHQTLLFNYKSHDALDSYTPEQVGKKKLVKHAQTLAWPIGTGKKQTLLLTKPETFGKFDRLCVM